MVQNNEMEQQPSSKVRFAALAATVIALLAISALSLPALGQGITRPPSGDNQKASVTQHIGLVKVTIDYSSPDESCRRRRGAATSSSRIPCCRRPAWRRDTTRQPVHDHRGARCNWRDTGCTG